MNHDQKALIEQKMTDSPSQPPKKTLTEKMVDSLEQVRQDVIYYWDNKS